MSDTRIERDASFEHDLRKVLSDMAPASVPASLRDAVAAIPRRPLRPALSPLAVRRRRLVAFAGIAAVAAVAAVSLALALGLGWTGNVAAPSPSAPSASAAKTGWVEVSFDFAETSSTPLGDRIRADTDILQKRLDAIRASQLAIGGRANGILVTMPDETAVQGVPAAVTTGVVALVPMGTSAPVVGQAIDLTQQPTLVGNAGIARARSGTDPAGQAAVDLDLTGSGSSALATWSTANVGRTLALVLDDKVTGSVKIAQPVTGGSIQIAVPGTADSLAVQLPVLVIAINSGPMPYPLLVASSRPVSAPASTPDWMRLTYGYTLPIGRPVDPSVVASSRLTAAHIPFAIEENGTQFSVTVPGVSVAQAEELLGTTGKLGFVPMGGERVESGSTLDLTAHPPMFGSEGVASAAPGVDAAGLATLDIVLAPAAKTAFATYTETHIGEFFAIVLDGKVLTAPVIQSSIPDGLVQITAGGTGGIDPAAQTTLIAILASGPLPVPITEVGKEPASAPATLSTPEPSQTPSPSATPSPSPSATPAPTSLPSFTVPTNLTVEPLPGAPSGIRQIVQWSGGFAAVAVNPAAPDTGSTLWSSPDGKRWSPMPGGPADGTGASPRALFLTPCRGGLLVLGTDTNGVADTTSDYSTDGSTWAQTTIPGSLLAPDMITGAAGDAAGVVVTAGDTHAIQATDCVSWRRVALPGSGPLAVRGVGIVGSRFMVTGYSGDPSTNAHVSALAWWSDDLASWHAVRPKTAADQGFNAVAATSDSLLVAEMTYPGYTPGQRSWWATADGMSWHELKAPLGVYDDGAGAGSVAGWITGSGGRIFDWGVPRSVRPGTAEFPRAILFASPTGLTMIGTGPAAGQ